MTAVDERRLTTVPARPAAPVAQRRRRTRELRRSDVLAMVGAVAGGVSLTGILWTQLGPFTGWLGWVVATWLAVVTLYAALVSIDESRAVMRDRISSFVVQSLASLLVIALLFALGYTIWNGWSAVIHPNFYTEDMRFAQEDDPLSEGGVLHAIVGTLLELGIALAVAVPLGLLAAVYLHEVPGRFSRFIRTVVEAMTALPDIIAGLFIYATLILIFHLGPSGFAAATALAVTILPIIIRAADVVLRLVPGSLKEASLALGASRWRTTWNVLLPTARPGLATAVILGAARAVGETSPVLLTAGATNYLNLDPMNGSMMSLPLLAYTQVQSSHPNEQARGFGTALVLLLLVVLLFMIARAVGGRAPGDLSARGRRRRAAASRRDLRRMSAPAQIPNPARTQAQNTVPAQEETGP